MRWKIKRGWGYGGCTPPNEFLKIRKKIKTRQKQKKRKDKREKRLHYSMYSDYYNVFKVNKQDFLFRIFHRF